MNAVLAILGSLGIIAILCVGAYFCIPGAVPGHKPDKENLRVMLVLAGILVALVIGTVLWNTFA